MVKKTKMEDDYSDGSEDVSMPVEDYGLSPKKYAQEDAPEIKYGSGKGKSKAVAPKERRISDELAQLRKSVQDGKILVGTQALIRSMDKGKIKLIYLASNCPADARSDLEHYASLAKVKLQPVELNNEELGLFCKKNFFVSAVGVLE
jgi:large subunit ribosomal protein L30e